MIKDNKELYKYCRLPVDSPFYDEVMHLQKTAIEKGELTYIDPGTGYIVFTALYHKQRGNCCGSGCRHCPFNAGAAKK